MPRGPSVNDHGRRKNAPPNRSQRARGRPPVPCGLSLSQAAPKALRTLLAMLLASAHRCALPASILTHSPRARHCTEEPCQRPRDSLRTLEKQSASCLSPPRVLIPVPVAHPSLPIEVSPRRKDAKLGTCDAWNKTERLLEGATSPCPQLRRNQVRNTMHTYNQEIHSFYHRKNHQRQAPEQSAPVRWGRTLSRAIATGDLQLHTVYPLCPNVPEFAPTRNASTPTVLPRGEHARQGQS